MIYPLIPDNILDILADIAGIPVFLLAGAWVWRHLVCAERGCYRFVRRTHRTVYASHCHKHATNIPHDT